MCLCLTLAMKGPPLRSCRPVLFRAVHHYFSSTLPLYLALMRFIAPKPPTARARLLTALVFCSSLRYFLLVRFAYLFFGDLWPVTPILIALL